MADAEGAQRKTCFVAMPISTPSLYRERLDDECHFAHVLDYLFKPALERAEYTVISPSVRGSELIQAEIIKNLEQADLVLCDLSSLNPNVFFELGIRTSLDRPVAIVKDNLTLSIPFDLNSINVLTYDGSLTPWTLGVQTELLCDHIKAATTGGNAMWRYFGLTKPAKPSEAGDNPIEAKIDLLLSEVTRLQLAQRSSERIEADDQQRIARWLTTTVVPALMDNGIVLKNLEYNARSRTFTVKDADTLPESVREYIRTLAAERKLIVKFVPDKPTEPVFADLPEGM